MNFIFGTQLHIGTSHKSGI